MLVCLAAAMSGAEGVVSGPWCTLQPTGDFDVGLRLDHHAEVLMWPDGVDVGEPLVARASEDAGGFTYHLVLAASAQDRDLVVTWQHGEREHQVTVRLPAVPGADEPVRVRVVRAATYPGPQLLRTDPRPDLVVVLDPLAAWQLGSGGWESQVPLALLGTGQWFEPLRWGSLALHLASDADALARSLAHDLSRHQVVIDPHARWRLDQPQPADDLARVLAVARHRRVPVMVAAPPGLGFYSDPLSVDRQGLIGALPGGTRYLALSGSEGVCRQLPRSVAHLFAAVPQVDISAAGHLRCQVHDHVAPIADFDFAPWPEMPMPHFDLGQPLAWDGQFTTWSAGGTQGPASPLTTGELAAYPLEAPQAGLLVEQLAAEPVPGLSRWLQQRMPWPQTGLKGGRAWGLGDPQSVLATLGDDTAPERGDAANHFAYLPAHACDQAERHGRLGDLIAANLADPAWAMLAERYAAFDPRRVLAWPDAPAAVLRHALLRYLVTDLDPRHADVRPVLVSADDPVYRRSLLDMVESGTHEAHERLVLDCLRAVVNGTASLDSDPLVQHRLLSVVFGSPYVSPTHLRPLAVALLESDQIDPQARGPIERFLTRHGHVRPRHR
jgi:hypothetical protein